MSGSFRLVARCRKSLFQVGDQVFRGFHSDRETDQGAVMGMGGLGALELWVAMDGEALIAAPGEAHSEDVQRIEKAFRARDVPAGKFYRKQAAGPTEIPFEKGVLRMVFMCRMKDSAGLGAGFQPVGDGHGGSKTALHANRHRPQPAQGEIDIIGTGMETETALGGLQAFEQGLIPRHDGPHEQIGMAADIFRQGLGRIVDTQLQRFQRQPGAPGVVDNGDHALFTGDLGDRRNVLHLHGQTARALQQDGLDIIGDQVGDLGAHIGGEEFGADAETRQDRGEEAAHRSVDAIGGEHFATRLDHSEDGERVCHKAGRGEGRTGPALQAGQRITQGRMGLQTDAAIMRASFGEIVERVRRRGEHGRAPRDGRVDLSALIMRSAKPGELGFVFHDQVSSVSIGVSVRRPHSDQEPS